MITYALSIAPFLYGDLTIKVFIVEVTSKNNVIIKYEYFTLSISQVMQFNVIKKKREKRVSPSAERVTVQYHSASDFIVKQEQAKIDDSLSIFVQEACIRTLCVSWWKYNDFVSQNETDKCSLISNSSAILTHTESQAHRRRRCLDIYASYSVEMKRSSRNEKTLNQFTFGKMNAFGRIAECKAHE